MSDFNVISYNNGVLTINGTSYNIQASGNSINGTSFSQVSLENNVLSIDGTEITLTEYSLNLVLSDNSILQDANDNDILITEE